MITKKIQLHSYACVKSFVELMNVYNCKAKLIDEEYVIDPKSIVGVLGIDLTDKLILQIYNHASDELLEKLNPFFAD